MTYANVFLQGDSGGPLQVKNSKEKYELAGNPHFLSVKFILP